MALVNSSKKMKNKTYHISETVPKSNRKIVERCNIDTPKTQVHDHSLSWLCTGTSIKSVRVNIVLLTQTFAIGEMMQSCKCK
jgi:hypothetical protein